MLPRLTALEQCPLAGLAALAERILAMRAMGYSSLLLVGKLPPPRLRLFEAATLSLVQHHPLPSSEMRILQESLQAQQPALEMEIVLEFPLAWQPSLETKIVLEFPLLAW